MITISMAHSAESAAQYYTAVLTSPDSYYTRTAGAWWGAGAALLGLTGEVTSRTFRNLAKNFTPDGRRRLTARTSQGREAGENTREGDRRSGYDLTFCVPKSVSLLRAFLDDAGKAWLDGLCERALYATLEKIQAAVECKVQTDGRHEVRSTGNLTAAIFAHHETRPVDGVPDPHSHWHCFLMNATHDGEEDQWKALELRQVVADKTFYEAHFNAILAGELRAAGLGIRRTDRHFELASVSRALIEKFSKRTRLIEERAKRDRTIIEAEAAALSRRTGMAIDDALATIKGSLGGRTREDKSGCIYRTRGDLETAWRESMMPDEWQSVQLEACRAARDENLLDVASAKDKAIAHLFARQSMKRTLHVAGELLRWGLGVVGVAEAETFPDSDARFYRPRAAGRLLTTHEVWAAEQSMLAMTLAGRDAFEPLGGGQSWTVQDPQVAASQEQREAVERVLQSRDLVTAVEAAAGSGKTTATVELVCAIETLSGRRAPTFAPSRAAVCELERRGFKHAETLQQLYRNPELQAAVAGNVLVVDESSFLSVQQMNWLIGFAARNRCRLVLLGDRRQLHSVDRGDGFRILLESGAVRPARLSRIYRQRVAALRSLVEEFSSGERDRVERGLDQLDDLGGIVEIADDGERRAAILEKHLATLAEGKTSLIVAATHAECRALAAQGRAAMRAQGLLSGSDVHVRVLTGVNLTDAQKSDPGTLEPGLIIEFHERAAGGFRSGERWTFTGVDAAGRAWVERDGVRRQLPAKHAGRFAAYRLTEIAVAVGDQLRVTKKMGAKDNGCSTFANGELIRVAAIDDRMITFEDGRKLDRDTGGLHLDQGVAITVESSQSRTVDVLLGSFPALSLGSVNRVKAYVALSRARDEALAFTDSKAALREATLKRGDRLSPHLMEASLEHRDETKNRRPAFQHTPVFAQGLSQDFGSEME